MGRHLFPEAVALIKAGEIEKGQRLLIRIVRKNPNHENAWLWLVNTTPKYKNQIGCLKKVLRINPEHETASKLIAQIREAQAKAEAEAYASSDTDMGFEYMFVLPEQNEVPDTDVSLPFEAKSELPIDTTNIEDLIFETLNAVPKQPILEIEGEVTALKAESDEAEFLIQSETSEEATQAKSSEEATPLAFQEDAAPEELIVNEAELEIIDDEGASKVAKIAQAALAQVALDEATLHFEPLVTTALPTQEEAISLPIKEEAEEAEEVYKFSTFMVMSKSRGVLEFLLNGRKQKSKAVIKIAPESGVLQIKAIDSRDQGDQHILYFQEIKMIECSQPKRLTFHLQSGKKIRLEDVTQLNKIVELLSPYIKVQVNQHFAKNPPQFEKPNGKLA